MKTGDRDSRYVAFLRAVNVGGRSVVRMDDLVQRLHDAGLEDVSSYRQSGNLILSSRIFEKASIAGLISDQLEHLTGRRTGVYVHPLDKLRELVKGDPFNDLLNEGDRGFATWMSRAPKDVPPLPATLGDGIILIGVVDNISFTIVRKDVGSGPVNELLERLFGVEATTRNWTSVKGLVGKADQDLDR
jgi:uncharacterized protein (DUF1697 family)